MSNLTLQLDVQHRTENIYVIQVADNQVADFCIGLMMLQYEEIDTLKLSTESALRFRKLRPKLKKKWNINGHGYALYAKTSVDLHLDKTFLDNLLIFYMKHHVYGSESTVDHSDIIFHSVRNHPTSINLTITFKGAGYITGFSQ